MGVRLAFLLFVGKSISQACPQPLLALREVAQANGGMTAIAERSHVKRESLYQMLSKRGNPELTSLFNVLHGMGLTITIQPMHEVGA